MPEPLLAAAAVDDADDDAEADVVEASSVAGVLATAEEASTSGETEVDAVVGRGAASREGERGQHARAGQGGLTREGRDGHGHVSPSGPFLMILGMSSHGRPAGAVPGKGRRSPGAGRATTAPRGRVARGRGLW